MLITNKSIDFKSKQKAFFAEYILQNKSLKLQYNSYFVKNCKDNTSVNTNKNNTFFFEQVLIFFLTLNYFSKAFFENFYYFDSPIFFYNLPEINFGMLNLWFIFGLLYLCIGFVLYHKGYNFNYHFWALLIFILFLLVFHFFSYYTLLLNLKEFAIVDSLRTTVSLPPKFVLNLPPGIQQQETKIFFFEKRVISPYFYFFIKFFFFYFSFFFLFVVSVFFIYCFWDKYKIHIMILRRLTITNKSFFPEDCNNSYKFLLKESWGTIFLIFLFVFIIFIIYYLGALKFLISNFDSLLVFLKRKKDIYEIWYILPFSGIFFLKTKEQIFKLFLMFFFLIFYKDKEPGIEKKVNKNELLSLRKKNFSILWYRFFFWLLVFNFLLLGFVGGGLITSPYKEELLETYEFLASMQLILFFLYAFWSPVTIIDYISPQSKAEIYAANPYLKKIEFNFENLGKKIRESPLTDEITIILWWIFLIFTVPGIELYFIEDDAFKEIIKFVFTKKTDFPP